MLDIYLIHWHINGKAMDYTKLKIGTTWLYGND